MNERYTRIYTLTNNLYAEGAPIIIKAGALLNDNETGNVLAQVKFENISQKKIIGLKINIVAFDIADRILDENIEYQYLNISAMPYSEFGSKNAIPLPCNLAQSFNITIIEVIFDDKSIWSENVEFKPIEQDLLSSVLKDSNIIEQYHSKTNSNGEFVPMKYKDLYLCTCGKAYKNARNICPACGKIFENLVETLDIDTLTQEKDEREKQQLEARKTIEEKRLKQHKKIAKFVKIIAPLLIIIAVVIIIINNIIIPNSKYNKAKHLVDSGDLDGASIILDDLGDFRDAQESLFNIRYKKADEFIDTKNYKDAISIFKEIYASKKITLDQRKQIFALWDNITEREVLSANDYHTVGLKVDGTVVAVGKNDDGKCNVNDWSDITSITAGTHHTVGLKADGTVIATGQNDCGQCNVSNWSDIVVVSAGYNHTVGLKADGTVIAIGQNDDGQCNVSDWSDMIAISAGDRHTIGLKADGTMIAVGIKNFEQCNVSDWRNIVDIDSANHTVGLKSDGTVIATGQNDRGQCDVSDWSDITAVSTALYHTVGLKTDGTVVTVGSDQFGKRNVGDWSNIVAVAAGCYHTVGLKSDGTVVAIGGNEYNFGQCDVSNWTDIKLP